MAGTGPTVLFRPPAGECGEDYLTFRVWDGAVESELATVTLRYSRRPFVRGNVNDDGAVDVGDAIYLLAFLFSMGSPPFIPESGDVNADGAIDIADPIALLHYLFADGNPPPAPFPDEGCP